MVAGLVAKLHFLSVALALLFTFTVTINPVAGFYFHYDARGTLYGGTNYNGWSKEFRLQGKECFNFRPSEDNKVYSVKMDGKSCAFLWEELDCDGSYVRADPYYPALSLNGKTSSMSNCVFTTTTTKKTTTTTTTPTTTTRRPFKSIEGGTVDLYDGRSCQDWKAAYQLSPTYYYGFTNLGPDDIYRNNLVSSVYCKPPKDQLVPTQTCFIQLWDYGDATGSSARLQADTGHCVDVPNWFDNKASSISGWAI